MSTSSLTVRRHCVSAPPGARLFLFATAIVDLMLLRSVSAAPEMTSASTSVRFNSSSIASKTIFNISMSFVDVPQLHQKALSNDRRCMPSVNGAAPPRAASMTAAMMRMKMLKPGHAKGAGNALADSSGTAQGHYVVCCPGRRCTCPNGHDRCSIWSAGKTAKMDDFGPALKAETTPVDSRNSTTRCGRSGRLTPWCCPARRSSLCCEARRQTRPFAPFPRGKRRYVPWRQWRCVDMQSARRPFVCAFRARV